MPTWFDSPSDIGSVLGIASIVLGALLWLIRNEIAKTRKEMKPNHGSSLRDQIDILVERQTDVVRDVRDIRAVVEAHNERLYSGLSKVHARLDDHIQDHLNNINRNKTDG